MTCTCTPSSVCPTCREYDSEFYTAFGHTSPKEASKDEPADARIPTCYVQFMGGAHCATPPVVEQPAAEAWPPRERWRVEFYDPLAKEWDPGIAFSDRERARERLDNVATYSPRWGDDTPTKRRLVRETTTWTVEEDDGTWVLSPEDQAAETHAAADEETP